MSIKIIVIKTSNQSASNMPEIKSDLSQYIDRYSQPNKVADLDDWQKLKQMSEDLDKNIKSLARHSQEIENSLLEKMKKTADFLFMRIRLLTLTRRIETNYRDTNDYSMTWSEILNGLKSSLRPEPNPDDIKQSDEWIKVVAGNQWEILQPSWDCFISKIEETKPDRWEPLFGGIFPEKKMPFLAYQVK